VRDLKELDITPSNEPGEFCKIRICVHCDREGFTTPMIKGDEHCPRCGRDQVISCWSPKFAGYITNLKA
jgi:rubrerythrin